MHQLPIPDQAVFFLLLVAVILTFFGFAGWVGDLFMSARHTAQEEAAHHRKMLQRNLRELMIAMETDSSYELRKAFYLTLGEYRAAE